MIWISESVETKLGNEREYNFPGKHRLNRWV